RGVAQRRRKVSSVNRPGTRWIVIEGGAFGRSVPRGIPYNPWMTLPADAERTRLARAAATSLADAQALIRAGRPGDAIPTLERITATAPGDAGAWVALGVARSMTGEHEGAVDAAARAVALAPRVAVVHLAHGDVLRM